MPRRASIRAQMLRLVLAVALPLAALNAWNLYSTAQAESQHARQGVVHLAQITASETVKFLGQAQNILNGLAARAAVSALDSSRCDPILKEFLRLAPLFANVVTMTIDGGVVCSAVPLAQLVRGDPDRFLKLMRGPDQLTVGKAAPGVITGRWVVPVGRPLLSAQGGIAGAVVLPLDLISLPLLPRVEGLPANAVVGLIAADGTVLASSLEAERYVGTKTGAGSTALRDKIGTADVIGIDGIPRIQGFTPVPGTDWIAFASVPASEFYAGVKAQIATSALLGIAILFAALLLAVRWSREIRDPITAVAHAANEVAAGNLAARAPVAGAAEIAEVATQFNRMLDARARDEQMLRESQATLRESERRFRATLENVQLVSLVIDTEGKITFCNDFLLALTGWQRNEVIGRSWFRTFLPESVRESVWKMFQGAIATGDLPLHDENEITTRAGAIRVIRWNNTVLRDTEGKITGSVSLGEDITERKRAEDALRESKARLQALTRRLLEVQETERRTLARELHDEVGGVLTAVKLNLQSLRRMRAGDPGDAALADGLALVDGAIQSVRSLSLDLRPAVLDDLGLIPALKWYCEHQAQRAGVAIELSLDAIDLKPAPQLESACFRIVQESVTNALRHANARCIQVELRRDEGSLVLEIADDGGGLDVAAARKRGLAGTSSGLLGMEERAVLLGGRLSINSAPGAGTRVRAEFAMPEGGFA